MTPLAANVAWYIERAGGFSAFGLLTLGTLLGLALSGRVRSTAWPRFAIEDVHRFVGLLTGTFVAIHVVTLLADSFMPFSLRQLVVPGTSSYRPLATALGVVAMELLLALALTNRLRGAVPYGFWRRAHYLNFGVWLLALVHGLMAGSDTRAAWALAPYALAAGSVAGLTAWRVLRLHPSGEWALRLWPAAAAVTVAELTVALALSPFRH